ncbi:hypothetical protein CDD83_10012 [Cordyceps sp. RAO-2017]|nr:hypothetical protein CDD83_10012 [Cordyceps sp. RAO-2017]
MHRPALVLPPPPPPPSPPPPPPPPPLSPPPTASQTHRSPAPPVSSTASRHEPEPYSLGSVHFVMICRRQRTRLDPSSPLKLLASLL